MNKRPWITYSFNGDSERSSLWASGSAPSNTPHIDRQLQEGIKQDALGGWRMDPNTGTPYNIFSGESGWDDYSNNPKDELGISFVILAGSNKEVLRGFHFNDGTDFYFKEGEPFYWNFRKNVNLNTNPDVDENWLNIINILNTLAGDIGFASDKFLTGTRLGSNASYSLAYNSFGNATKLIRPVGYGTSITGALIGTYKFSNTENKTWGTYGQLGISYISSGLTFFEVTAPVGIVIGTVDTFGGFNGFYHYLDNQQQLYNTTGYLMVPINGVPSYIKLK